MRSWKRIIWARKFISRAENLALWSNPISHAVVVGKRCFVGEQLSVSTEDAYISGAILEKVTLPFSHFLAAVKAAGFTKKEIVCVDITFIDLGEVDTLNTFYGNLFSGEKRPPRTIYKAAALPSAEKSK